MCGRLWAMWTGFWRFIDAVQDGVADFFRDWKRTHVIAAPLGILLTTLYLWQSGEHPLTIDRVASLIPLGTLIYVAIISGTEVLIGMFYAIAKHLERKDKLNKQMENMKEEARAEGETRGKAAVLAELEGIISIEQMAELKARFEQEENGAAY